MKPEKILFIDIETIPQIYHYEALNDRQRLLFDQKVQYQLRTGQSSAELYNKSGILAEFGKVICVSYGYFSKTRNGREMIIKSCYGHSEKKLLTEFSRVLNNQFSGGEYYLCAHNGKEFDFPYLCRRMLIHHMKLPDILRLQNKKPWEVQHLDTMEMWKFGDYKHFTSLDLLAEVLGVPSPKSDMQGKDVAKTYWEEKDLKKIVAYCEQDVRTLMRIYLRFQGIHQE